MIKVHALKPKRSNLDPKLFDRAIEKVLDDGAVEGERLLSLPTKTWKHRVTFTISRSKGKRVIKAQDPVYSMLDKGTRKHKIRPRNGKLLAFKSGHRAKTSPGSLTSAGGGATGSKVFAKEVNHPGTKPRRWSREAAKVLRKKVAKDMKEKWLRG